MKYELRTELKLALKPIEAKHTHMLYLLRKREALETMVVRVRHNDNGKVILSKAKTQRIIDEAKEQRNRYGRCYMEAFDGMPAGATVISETNCANVIEVAQMFTRWYIRFLRRGAKQKEGGPDMTARNEALERQALIYEREKAYHDDIVSACLEGIWEGIEGITYNKSTHEQEQHEDNAVNAFIQNDLLYWDDVQCIYDLYTFARRAVQRWSYTNSGKASRQKAQADRDKAQGTQVGKFTTPRATDANRWKVSEDDLQVMKDVIVSQYWHSRNKRKGHVANALEGIADMVSIDIVAERYGQDKPSASRARKAVRAKVRKWCALEAKATDRQVDCLIQWAMENI